MEEIHSLSGDNPPDRQEKIILVGGEKSWWMKREILLAGEDEILLFEETGEGPSGKTGLVGALVLGGEKGQFISFIETGPSLFSTADTGRPAKVEMCETD